MKVTDATSEPRATAASSHDEPPHTVVIISAVVPEPRDSGKKVVLAGMLDYWRDRVGAENVHYVLIDEPATDSSAMWANVHRIRSPSSAEQATSVLLRSVLTGRHTLQESTLFSPRVRDELRSVLADIGAELEIFDTVRMAQYASQCGLRPGVRRIVYLDDLFSVRYGRMLDLLRDHPEVNFDPLGTFRARLPAIVARAADIRGSRRLLLSWERRVVARREKQVAIEFETTLLISPEEVHRLAADAPGARVRELPPTVDVVTFERRLGPRPTFVLIGLLELAHNLDAVTAFLDECMPAVIDAMPTARVHIVGRGAPQELHARVARFGGAVSLDGFVPDLKGLLSRSTAIVVPMRFGSGIKLKLIEALAHGVPVISTPVGAEGIETGTVRGVIVERELSGFAGVMASVCEPALNAELAQAARDHYLERYSPQAAFRRYDEAFAR